MSSSVASQDPSKADAASALTPAISLGIVSSDWHAVRGYLDQYPDLAPWLPPVCEAARREFGPETVLALELYKDPEIDDRFLILYVRQRSYDAGLMDRIESVNRLFNPALEQVAGYFLVATDFRKA
jgi:hypothetical protein